MSPWQIQHFTADGHIVERFHPGDLLSSDGAGGSKATTVHLATRHTFQVPYKDLPPFDQCGCHLSSRLTSLGASELPEHFLWVTESLEGCTTSEPDTQDELQSTLPTFTEPCFSLHLALSPSLVQNNC